MKAVRCEVYGPPASLVVREVPDPVPGPGEVVVEIHAAGVNFPDVLLIANRYQVPTRLPFIPGNEFAGRVIQLGPDVTGFAAGDVVMGTALAGGAFAERVAVPARALRPVPAGLDMVHAAAFGVTYRTAYHALVTIGGLKPDDWVVVLGAAGGVGTACVDLASRLGARVIAAVSSRDRVAICQKLGAVGSIVYSHEDVKTAIRRFTAPGAEIVIDPVGGSYAEQALRSTRWGGRFVCVGFAAGEIPRIPLNLVLLKGVIVRGFELRTLADHLPDAIREEERTLARLAGAGMRPEVSECYPLDQAAAALERVAGRQVTGKIVITPVTAPGKSLQEYLYTILAGQGGPVADEVLVEHDDRIAIITINRPHARNAINHAVSAAMAEALAELDERADLTVGIITGAGGTFSSGMDLKAFLAGENVRAEGKGLAGLTEAPPRKPLIAAVEGWALAGGCEVALACDLIVAASDAKFGIPEVKRGLVAGAGGLVRLPRRIPAGIAMELALTGDPLSSADAYRLGLVNALTEPGEALDGARKLAARIAVNGPLAVAATKQIITQQHDWDMADVWGKQEPIMRPAFQSDDAREGALAFAEKRAPVWKGR